MHKRPFQQALERIRAEYLEMPGMRLAPAQVERLSGVDRSVCRQVLDALRYGVARDRTQLSRLEKVNLIRQADDVFKESAAKHGPRRAASSSH